MAPNQSPKKRGGRPRKHATETDAAEAVRQSKLRSYHRARRQSRQPNGPADFIAYEPPLHGDVPADTPPETGLRTNIRIPQDPNTQQDNARPRPPPDPQPSAEQPTAEEDAEINEQIRRIQTKEQEMNTEQAERDAEIAEILLGMRAAEQAEDIGGEELDMPESANEAGAANTPDISGLQTVATFREERISKEES